VFVYVQLGVNDPTGMKKYMSVESLKPTANLVADTEGKKIFQRFLV